MSRRKSSHKASAESGFGRLLKITILLSIVFSAGLITGQRLLHNASLAPLVTVQSPALSTATERHLAPNPEEKADGEVPARSRFSFYEKLANPSADDTEKPSRRFLTPKPQTEPQKPVEPQNPAPAQDPEPTQAPEPVKIAQAPDKKQLPTLSLNTTAPTPAAKPESPQAPARYTLQIGAYPSYERARQEMTRLEKIGLEPHVIAAEVPGQGKFFRVRVGKFHSMDEARTYQSDTREKNNIDTFVTPL